MKRLGKDFSTSRHTGGHLVQPPEDIEALYVDLELAGHPCNIYGDDLKHLRLEVVFQTTERLHVKIFDADSIVYQVPEELIPIKHLNANSILSRNSKLAFWMIADPFSFTITRHDSGMTLFNTSGSSLVFESQYLQLRTQLPVDPFLYGLGEHSDSFRLPTSNYTRTLWNRDAGGAPPGENLYGSHPVYLDHRFGEGTHGVFLLNSNGMTIEIDKHDDAQYLEYNALGGILDFYFLAGPSPIDVSKQYAEVVGKPEMPPYWALGFHQCKFGMKSIEEFEEVVANYSQAKIPLEAMWIDIDYMDRRQVFSLDPEGFPRDKVSRFVEKMHAYGQKVVMMVDPAVYAGSRYYDPYLRGVEQDVFLHKPIRKSSKPTRKTMGTNDTSVYHGIVWPGAVSFPDFFHNPATQSYWAGEIGRFFFNPKDGQSIDVDGIWIDMNEVSQFCDYPCDAGDKGHDGATKVRGASANPLAKGAIEVKRPRHGFEETIKTKKGTKKGLPGRDLLSPRYDIGNKAGRVLSDRTLDTDILHANGLAEYDTHNLYALTMARTTYTSLLHHHPTKRPFLLTRSTSPSSSRYTSHWLGDNISTFSSLRQSLSSLLQFTSLYSQPHIGADVCGFLSNTTAPLCARWTALAAFAYPFYRNHAVDTSTPQESYRWPSVAEAARRAGEIRYRLLDYMYTAIEKQSRTGEAATILPLWFLYPEDARAAKIAEQVFLGDAVMVSPVVYADRTHVDVYFPAGSMFYRFDMESYNFTLVQGTGDTRRVEGIELETPPPLHLRAGSIIPVRAKDPMKEPNAETTVELRQRNFEVYVAPNEAGAASGTLYIDDGVSLDSGLENTSLVDFRWTSGSVFTMRGRMNYTPADGKGESVLLQYVYILGATTRPRKVVRTSPRLREVDRDDLEGSDGGVGGGGVGSSQRVNASTAGSGQLRNRVTAGGSQVDSGRAGGAPVDTGTPKRTDWHEELETDYYSAAQLLVVWVSAPMSMSADPPGGEYSFEVIW
ncbi:MAG: hypothetical protein M1831_000654 [Alyxoria varia]|nr:MAG: hypothetical protein M1831_000654 [Alyxoria varia]